jgi:hypothetical protein
MREVPPLFGTFLCDDTRAALRTNAPAGRTSLYFARRHQLTIVNAASEGQRIERSVGVVRH